MSIRIKIFTIITVLFLLLSAVEVLIQQSVILPSFLKLEQDEAGENLRRIMGAIQRELLHIDRVCHDWASWDDTYAYVVTRSQDYQSSNLSDDTFTASGLNLLCYFDMHGAVVWGKAYDLENETEIPLPFPAENPFPQNHPLLSLKKTGDDDGFSQRGVLMTEQGPLLFASRPILKTDGSGPSRGVLTMGRLLSGTMLNSLQENVRLAFRLDYPLSPEATAYAKDVRSTYQEPDMTYFTLKTEEVIDVWTVYNDALGDPAFSVYYQFPRDITRKGLASIRFALVMVFGAGCLVLVILMAFLQLVVIRPLRRLTAHALSFKSHETVGRRLSMKSRDEVGQLARAFDNLMATIAKRTDALKQANGRLEELSRKDGLTGIANRRVFDEHFEREWKRGFRNQTPLSLIIADVDYFKRYNDIYGHKMGDDCLVTVAEALEGFARRPLDLAARYGGEEFAVILPETDAKGAYLAAEEIRKAVCALDIPHRGSDVAGLVTLSLGVNTTIPGAADELHVFFEGADLALYAAKKSGRNRTVMAPGKEEGTIGT